MKKFKRWRSAVSITAALAVLSSLLVAGSPALADGETASLQMEFAATGATTRQSGTPFTALASFSCVSPTGASCDDAVMTIPWPADPDLSFGTTGIDSWTVTAASNVEGLLDSGVVSDAANRQWIIKLDKSIPSDGSAVGVQLSFTSPTLTTPDGFRARVQATVTGSTFAPVESPANLVYTVTARLDHSIAKTLSGTVLAGQEARWSISWRDGQAGMLGTLGTMPGTRKIVDALPPEVEFVGVTPATAPHSYDEATHTLTFLTTEQAYPSGQRSYGVIARVKDDVADGVVISNTATLSFQAVGSAAEITAASTVQSIVNEPIDPGSIFSKSVATNLGASGPGTTQVATAATTSSEIRYWLSASQSVNPIKFEMVDQIPCLAGAVSRVESGAVDASCLDVAFHVKSLRIGSDPVAGAGTDSGKTVTLRYTDGSSDTFPMVVGTRIYPREAMEVNRVTFSGTHPSGTGSSMLEISGVLDASLEGRPEVLGMQNISYNRVAPTARPFPATYTPYDANAIIVRDAMSAAVSSAPSYVLESSANTTLRIQTTFLAVDNAVANKRRTVVVLPDSALQFTNYAASAVLKDDWQGTGREYLDYGRSNPGGGWVTRGQAPAGVYPYDVYVGFPGEQFPACVATPNGTHVTGNDIFVDTTGIIGDVGEPTTVCHQTGYLVVPGPIPDSSTVKTVRAVGDAAWLSSPGTSEIASDGTGAAEFKVTWANTGAAPLQNVTVYDMLPNSGDAYTVGLKAARGTSFTPGLRQVAAPSGWTIGYSVAQNPCRPEVLAVNPGCDPEWVTTAPSDLSSVTALRFQKMTPSAIGTVADFIITMDADAMDPERQVAWNSAATRAFVAGTTPTPIAVTETPKVGFGLVEGPGILLTKEVCTSDDCADDAAAGTGGWSSTATIPYGADAKWRVTATNVGQIDLTDVVISDPVVAACALDVGNLAIDAQARTVCTSAGLTAGMDNTATVTGNGDGQTVSDTATASVTVGATPVSSIALAKQVCDASDQACDANAAVDAAEWKSSVTLPFEGTANWRVIVTNTGETTLTNAVVTDLANMACATTIASLAPAASQTLSCANADLGSSMVNTAAVSATPPFSGAPVTDSDTATATVTVAAPAVSLTKEVCTTEADCAEGAALGEGGWSASASIDYFDSVQWRLIATNTGETQLTSLEIVDPLVADCAFESTAPLDRGESVVVVCESEEVTESFVNSATVTAVDANAVEVTDTATAEVGVGAKPVSDLELSYESCDPDAGACDPDAAIGEGGWSSSTTVPFEGEGLWRVTVTNSGDTTLTNVRVENEDYPDCVFSLSQLLAGASDSRVCSVDSVDGLLTGTGTATATPPYGDEDLVREDSAEIVSVPPTIQIDVQKEVCSTGDDCDPEAESLSGGWVKQAELEPGAEPLWRVITTNTSQVKLVNVQLADPDLAGCTTGFEELAAGASKTVTCTGSAVFETTGSTVVATGTNPRTPGTETVTAESDASVLVRAFTSEVALVKEACVVADGSDCLVDGTGWTTHASGKFASEMWWRITVTNGGDTDLTEVAVTDARFAVGDFTVDRLGAGESKSLVFSAGEWKVVDPESPDAKNTATVTALGVQGDTLSAESSAIGTVDPAPEEEVTPPTVPAPPVSPAPDKLSTTGSESPMLPLFSALGLLLVGALIVSRRRA